MPGAVTQATARARAPFVPFFTAVTSLLFIIHRHKARPLIRDPCEQRRSVVYHKSSWLLELHVMPIRSSWSAWCRGAFITVVPSPLINADMSRHGPVEIPRALEHQQMTRALVSRWNTACYREWKARSVQTARAVRPNVVCQASPTTGRVYLCGSRIVSRAWIECKQCFILWLSEQD